MNQPSNPGAGSAGGAASAPAQTFPCKNCGAQLAYDAASRGMACQFCGYKDAVAAQATNAQMQASYGGPPSATIREIALEEGLAIIARGAGAMQASVTNVTCKDCGATVNVGEGERTTSCAFCGSKQVLSQQTNDQPIRPESMVPFAIPKDDANKRFAAWLSALWFRPSDLKRIAKVQEMGGVYVPYWTFASDVSSQWNAERGYYYYETESYTANENGQNVQRTRQVQRTRWESAWGTRQDSYRDVLVCAGRGLPEDLVAKLASFNCRQLVPYEPRFLAGWRAESYALDLNPGWGRGQQLIAEQQTARCARDVGGDTHRNVNVSNQFSQVTFKHVLLPIWIAAYRYNGKVFRFLVNGQTGEVVGKAPWSFWKIFFLVATILIVIGIAIAIYYFTHQEDF